MAKEIERRFIVDGLQWSPRSPGAHVYQGYLAIEPKFNVRVRSIDAVGYLTVKSDTGGPVRDEFEYEIPQEDADKLLLMCGARKVEKIRYHEEIHNRDWVIDVFTGSNAGLIVAEVEFETEDDTNLMIPSWVIREVTGERAYGNASLATRPFSEWT